MAKDKTDLRLSIFADSDLVEQRSASIHLPASLNASSVPSMEMPPNLQIETVDLNSGDDSIPKNADVLSNALEALVAGMRDLFVPMGDLSKQAIVRVELVWNDQSLAWSRVGPNATVVCTENPIQVYRMMESAKLAR